MLRPNAWAIVHPGVYVDHTGPLTWLQRAWAAVLSVWPAALCGESALRAAEGPGRRDRDRSIHVAVAHPRHVVAPAGVHLRRCVRLDERVLWNAGPPRLRYEDAAIDVAIDAVREFDAIGVLADAVQSRRTTARRLLGSLASRERVPRRAWLEGVLTDIAEGTCSVLEHGYLTRVERPHGLPRALRQQPAPQATRMAYRDAEYGTLIVELDGRLFHNTAGQRDKDFERDLDAAVDGRDTTRVSWGQVFDRSCSTAGKVGKLLHRRSAQAAKADSAPNGHDQAMAVVIDGGLSNALAERGHDLTDDLWTARVLRDAPDEVEAVHRAYFEAGAQVATTASYQTTDPGLLIRSVAVARAARDAVGHGWVAASVGPYGAVLADGSEYRGRYGVPASTLRDFHAPRLEVLAAEGPDFLAVETIPDLDEAEVLAALLTELGLRAWFSYSIAGLRTRADQPLEAAFAVAGSAASVFAVGVNCCAPVDVLPAVRLAVHTTGKPAVAYPNSGETWDATTRGWSGESGYDVSLARDWADAGAEWIGGCCRVGPRDIAALARVLV